MPEKKTPSLSENTCGMFRLLIRSSPTGALLNTCPDVQANDPLITDEGEWMLNTCPRQSAR